MIKITDITINNFRSFKNSGHHLYDCKNINVMVGRNNVGKTNVLRALYLFFNPESFNPTTDRNMVKQITNGQSKDPIINIKLFDKELIKGEEHTYNIICNINKKKEGYYIIASRNESIKSKFTTPAAIKTYLNKKFKCMYISTTDEDIDIQSNAVVKDMILKFYKSRNKEVRTSIEEFEEQYKKLVKTFSENINDIENQLESQFTGLNEIGISPKLTINTQKEITNFLLENVSLKIDDSYQQDISEKGAGIQRTSLIMLTLFLVTEIYKRENIIVLLDEPEAFLYPLLEKKVKSKVENSLEIYDNIQYFMTTHSRTFLHEINNEQYRFYYLSQKIETQSYARSSRDKDINKYTVIEDMTPKNKYEVLNNYGLLDEIDDYENVIICEGLTDYNYIKCILKDKEFIPQIRCAKYSDGSLSLKHNYVGRGATSILVVLEYLDKISPIQRKVLVLLDGDSEGKSVEKKILPNEYEHLTIKKLVLDENKEVEDMVFSPSEYANRVLSVTPSLQSNKTNFINVISQVGNKESVVQLTEDFVKGNKIPDADINNIKHYISVNLNADDLNKEWFLNEAEPFFYNQK